MVTTNIIQRTFQLLHNGHNASCYTIEKGHQQFLVSAAHVFDGSPEVKELTIFEGGRWTQLQVEVAFNSVDAADTIVFKLPRDISPRHPIEYGTAGIMLGGWAYFLGFPFGLRTPGEKINNNYPLPFVKAGLVSSFNFERHGVCTIYLDGHNNKGFSGGPVVWIPPEDPKRISIIGTVSGYMMESPIASETKADVTMYGTNAGIIEAFWVTDLFDNL